MLRKVSIHHPWTFRISVSSTCAEPPATKKLITAMNNAFLVRHHIEKDSTWTEPSTDCYYVKNAAMNMDHVGWHWPTDLKENEGDFFNWDAETVGMVKLELKIPKGTTSINFDTISKLNYDFINYFYGYSRSDSTIDNLSGLLTFKRISDSSIKVDGMIFNQRSTRCY